MTTKKRLLFVLGLAISFCLYGLITSMVLAVDDEEGKPLKMDLTNAVQHIKSIKLIPSNGAGSGATLKSVGDSNLVGIITNNFAISQTGTNKNQITSSTNSNILGGIKNKIRQSQFSSILGGKGNQIAGDSKYSTILGGSGNSISSGMYSTILGGSENMLSGAGSVIAGGISNSLTGNYSVIVGKNNELSGDNSVALGVNSKVGANNSFLWTDNNNNDRLLEDNVFTVVSQHGMVVNESEANALAKLTIGGPLVVGKGNNDIQACNATASGIIKVVDGDDNRKCLCGCDGNEWHSLYGEGTCEKTCHTDMDFKPECGDTVYKCSKSGKNYFVGTCVKGTPVSGMGAYVVTNNNEIHWSCQTDDGAVAKCIVSGSTPGNSTTCA